MAAKPNIPLLSRAPKPDEVSRRVNSIIRWIYSIGPLLTSLKDMVTVQDLVNTGLFTLTNGALVATISLTSGLSVVGFTQAHLVGGVFTYSHGRGRDDLFVQVRDENNEEVTPDTIDITTATVSIDVTSWGDISGKVFTLLIYG